MGNNTSRWEKLFKCMPEAQCGKLI